MSVFGARARVTTGDNGRFRIVSLPRGDYVLFVRRLGYAAVAYPVRLEGIDTVRLSIGLTPIAARLDPLTVTAKSDVRMDGFEERRKLGFGHFLTQEEIEQRHSTSIAYLLRAVPSVTIHEVGFVQIARSLRATGPCAMQVYLDGVRLPNKPVPTNLADMPSPRELAGIEVYSGPATIPLKYKSADTGCGVILIWTRTGE